VKVGVGTEGPILKHKHHQLQNLENEEQQHKDKVQQKQQANKGPTNTKTSAR